MGDKIIVVCLGDKEKVFFKKSREDKKGREPEREKEREQDL